jgi:hypothetical protein
MGKPSREHLKFYELIRDAIAILIERGEIKIPRKKTATLAANQETQRAVLRALKSKRLTIPRLGTTSE